MKRILWLVVLGAAVWGLSRVSHPAVDVGKLDPVETVLLTVTETGMVLETDTGARGFGKTPGEAWQDLRRTAETEVFPDTASKLMIRGDPSGHWEEIFGMFRPSCVVCRTEERPDLEKATAYLSVHRPYLTLNRIRGGENRWQRLLEREGRYLLEPE